MAYAAHVLDQMPAKFALILINVVLTAILAPLAILGVSFGVSAVSYGAWESLPIAVVGGSGLLGLAGAWLRTFLGSARLRAAPVTRYVIATMLIVGVVDALFILSNALRDPRAWPVSLYVLATGIGVWCLAATIWLDDRVA